MSFIVGDPETGWPPFLDWLTAHGLDPSRVREVNVDGDQGTAVVCRLNDEGYRYVIPGTDSVAVEDVTFAVASPPPRRT